MGKFNLNQIVKGKVAGYFVIVGFQEIAGEMMAKVKEVNPANFAETAPGELALPFNAIEAVA